MTGGDVVPAALAARRARARMVRGDSVFMIVESVRGYLAVAAAKLRFFDSRPVGRVAPSRRARAVA